MICCSFFFFFNDTSTTEIYTLSLHDALPISWWPRRLCGPSLPELNMKSHQLFAAMTPALAAEVDRKSTRLNSSHLGISYAVFCLKKKKRDDSESLEKDRPPTV